MSRKHLLVNSAALLVATGCLSAARRSSGAIGCPASEITISNESPGVMGDHTWTAECHGRTYYCSMNAGNENSAANVTCTPEGGADDSYGNYADPFAASAAPPSWSSTQATTSKESEEPSAPPGIAGFKFGMSEEEAASACSTAGYTWRGDAKPACSAAPVPVGIDGEVQLRFCDGGLCRAALAMSRPDPEFGDIERTFVRLVKALRQKYGKAQQLHVPGDACAEDIPQCLRSGNGLMQALWQWKAGHSIRVAVAVEDGRSTLTLFYKAPESIPSKALQGL